MQTFDISSIILFLNEFPKFLHIPSIYFFPIIILILFLRDFLPNENRVATIAGTAQIFVIVIFSMDMLLRTPLYDRDHKKYGITAFEPGFPVKSLRGSDVDAALYWLARMLAGGEDPRYVLRRLTRFASEDIGLADPQALPQALACWNAYDRMGSPEGELAVAQCTVYLATAPKSNAIHKGFAAAKRAARATGSLMPPAHILNAPTPLMKDLGYGADYAYDHDSTDGFSGQNYFPDAMERQRGFEREIIKRLAWWEKLRRKGESSP